MGNLCHQQPPAATPQRCLTKAGDGAALPGFPLLLLLLLLASSMPACKGAPMPSQALKADQDLQLWKEFCIIQRYHRRDIDDACSAYLSTDSQPQASSVLEELCFLVMGFLQKPQVTHTKDYLAFLKPDLCVPVSTMNSEDPVSEVSLSAGSNTISSYSEMGLDEKDNTKRFLFHYSKTHDSGNSDIMSSVLHPLLQLVPQLNERRLKRYKVDEELQGPGGIQSRGYFFYRPRNGRRSVDFR